MFWHANAGTQENKSLSNYAPLGKTNWLRARLGLGVAVGLFIKTQIFGRIGNEWQIFQLRSHKAGQENVEKILNKFLNHGLKTSDRIEQTGKNFWLYFTCDQFFTNFPWFLDLNLLFLWLFFIHKDDLSERCRKSGENSYHVLFYVSVS